MKRLMSYFFKGLLILVPLVVTLYVVYLVFNTIDNLLHIPIPGVGFVATILFIFLVGFLTPNIFAKGLLILIDNTLGRLPIIKILYNSLKDLIGAFVGDKKIFDKPVLATLSTDSSVKVLGFITKEDMSFLGIKDHVAVYLPQSYNFAGNLIILPKNQVTPIDRDSSEVMTFIVSAGISSGSKKP
jgi:uncharacterized membrane protein